MDYGTQSSESVHYPHFADALCKNILDGSVHQDINFTAPVLELACAQTDIREFELP